MIPKSLSFFPSSPGKMFPRAQGVPPWKAFSSVSCAKAALPALGNVPWPEQPWGGKREGFGRAGVPLAPK